LRNTNVLGTCEVLRLATSGKPKAFHHVSSLAVAASAPALGGSYAPETFRIPSVDGINSGYIQSKWVAEQLVNSAAQGGLSVCIYRPGLITGHSRSGACNPHDALSLMLHACLQLRAAPDSWERVYLTPVDYVSQAVCELSRQRGSGSKAFHIVNSRYIPWRRITEALAECLDVDRTLPYRDWLAHLVSRATDGADASLSALASLLPATLETGNSEPPRYHDTNTRQDLAAAPHLRFPDNDVAVLMKQLEWLRVSGRRTGALCSAPEGQ
jgi:thioester reductase-like protein